MAHLETIKKRPDFLAVRGGIRASAPGFLIEGKARKASGPDAVPDAKQAPACSTARFGFTVTKKLGNAVCRNRIRRRLRAAINATAADHAVDGFDYVVVARPAALEMPYSDLVTDASRCLERIKSQRATSPSGGRQGSRRGGGPSPDRATNPGTK